MNKSDIVDAMVAELKLELRRLQAANEEASAGATDSESRAESKWDTQGLEASYLARGYAQQFETLSTQAETLRSFDVHSFVDQPIGLGALIECEVDGYGSLFFLSPCCGGMEVEQEGQVVTVITPESPIGAALLKRRAGDAYRLPSGMTGTISRVW